MTRDQRVPLVRGKKPPRTRGLLRFGQKVHFPLVLVCSDLVRDAGEAHWSGAVPLPQADKQAADTTGTPAGFFYCFFGCGLELGLKLIPFTTGDI